MGDATQLQFQVEYSKEDVLAAHKLHVHFHPSKRMIRLVTRVLAAAFFTVAVVHLFYDGGWIVRDDLWYLRESSFFIYAFLLLVLPEGMAYFQAWLKAGDFHEQTKKKKTHFNISHDKIHIKGALGTSELHWDTVSHFAYDDDLALLYVTDAMVMVPKRSMDPTEWESFLQVLHNKSTHISEAKA